jgi:hypothetical protein
MTTKAKTTLAKKLLRLTFDAEGSPRVDLHLLAELIQVVADHSEESLAEGLDDSLLPELLHDTAKAIQRRARSHDKVLVMSYRKFVKDKGQWP